MKTTTWNANKCPIFKATLPLKPATIALKIGHLAFQAQHFVFFDSPQSSEIEWPLSIPNCILSSESTPWV